jgi:hypothetical protein
MFMIRLYRRCCRRLGMNPRANQWHGACQPIMNFVPFLLLGYEPRFDRIQRNEDRPMP